MTANTHRMVRYSHPVTGWEGWRLTDGSRQPVDRKGRKVIGKASQDAVLVTDRHGFDCDCIDCRLRRSARAQIDNEQLAPKAERLARAAANAAAFEERIAGYIAKAEGDG